MARGTARIPKFVQRRSDGALRRRRTALWAVAGVAAAGVLAGALYAVTRGPARRPATLELASSPSEVGVPAARAGCTATTEPKDQGNHVITPSDEHPAYSSTPATSGWHLPGPVSPGVHGDINSPEAVLANLAQGHVAIWYTGGEEMRRDLTRLLVLFKSEQIVAVPADELDLEHPIVLTGWGKLQRCARLSGAAIADFFQKHKGNGPAAS